MAPRHIARRTTPRPLPPFANLPHFGPLPAPCKISAMRNGNAAALVWLFSLGSGPSGSTPLVTLLITTFDSGAKPFTSRRQILPGTKLYPPGFGLHGGLES